MFMQNFYIHQQGQISIYISKVVKAQGEATLEDRTRVHVAAGVLEGRFWT